MQDSISISISYSFFSIIGLTISVIIGLSVYIWKTHTGQNSEDHRKLREEIANENKERVDHIKRVDECITNVKDRLLDHIQRMDIHAQKEFEKRNS